MENISPEKMSISSQSDENCSASSSPQSSPSEAAPPPPCKPSSYDHLKILGDGAYGTVFLGKNRSDDSYVALKQIKFSSTDDGVPVSALREISMLRHLEKFKHPNIVRLLDISHHRKSEDDSMSLSLVFEFVEYDLFKYMSVINPLSPVRVQSLMHQILCGIDFLHTNRVVHRDMKPQNILITKNHRVKIADFGLARIYDFYTNFTSVVVTLWYRSPELLLGREYATPVDVWSCGCIFAEMLRGSPLFGGTTEIDQLTKIFSVLETPDQADWPAEIPVTIASLQKHPRRTWEEVIPTASLGAIDVIKKMLTFKGLDRLRAHEALEHPYFKGLPVPEFCFASTKYQDPTIPGSSPVEMAAMAEHADSKKLGSCSNFSMPQVQNESKKRSLERDDESNSSAKRMKSSPSKNDSHSQQNSPGSQQASDNVNSRTDAGTRKDIDGKQSLECTESMPETPADRVANLSCEESMPETPTSSEVVSGLLMLGTQPASSSLACEEAMPETPVVGGSRSMFCKVQPKRSDQPLPHTNDENNPNAGNKASIDPTPGTSGVNLADQKMSDLTSSSPNRSKSPCLTDSPQNALPQK